MSEVLLVLLVASLLIQIMCGSLLYTKRTSISSSTRIQRRGILWNEEI